MINLKIYIIHTFEYSIQAVEGFIINFVVLPSNPLWFSI
jgi:hypothetical protein